MSGSRGWLRPISVALLALLLVGGGPSAAQEEVGEADVSAALLVTDDLPPDLVSAMGVTHEPAFDYDGASFADSGGLDAVAQTWQAAEVLPDSPVVIVFDFRFLFPSEEAAQAYLEAAEPILSESITGISLSESTPTVGDELRHYSGSLSQGDVTIEAHNFLMRIGPVAAKVYIAGFGTTLDDALPIAQAAADRTDAWLAEQPLVSTTDTARPAAETFAAGSEVRQWASEAAASSQYGSASWAATQATGAPDVELVGTAP